MNTVVVRTDVQTNKYWYDLNRSTYQVLTTSTGTSKYGDLIGPGKNIDVVVSWVWDPKSVI